MLKRISIYIITLSVVLTTLILPITASAAVTETNGDGYALYNGVKLPNIDAVWTDKETYPYAYLSSADAGILMGDDGLVGYTVAALYMSTQAFSHDTANARMLIPGNELVSYFTDSADLQAMLVSYGSPYGLNEWGEIIADDVDAVNDDSFELSEWANYDILNTDGSVYLAASDPIPLDGMNVTEWDGDTEGLEVVESCFFKVSDTPFEIDASSQSVYVYQDVAEGVRYCGFAITATGSDWGFIRLDDETGEVPLCATSYDASLSEVDLGNYFYCIPGTVYTSLIAYPASSGDTGDIVDPDPGPSVDPDPEPSVDPDPEPSVDPDPEPSVDPDNTGDTGYTGNTGDTGDTGDTGGTSGGGSDVLDAIGFILSASWDFFTEIKVPGFNFSFAALFVGLFLATLGLRLLFMMLGIGFGHNDASTLSHVNDKPKNKIGF